MSIYKSSSLAMIPTAYKDGKLYSVRPNDGDGDFTFSRGSNLAATRVDVNGLIEKGRENTTTYSQDSSQWSDVKLGIVGSSNTDPFNGSSAVEYEVTSITGAAYFYRTTSPSISSGQVVTGSVYIKNVDQRYIQLLFGSAAFGNGHYQNFDLQTGTKGTSANIIDSSIESVGNGWYRLSITKQATASASSGLVCGFVPSSSATRLQAPSTLGLSLQAFGFQTELGLVATDYIETGASTAQAGILEDMPRLDYSGGASCPALLLEPQRTNQISNSEYYGASGWTRTRMSITSNAGISPDGTNNASYFVEDSSNNSHQMESNVVTGTGSITGSVFAKSGSRNEISLRLSGGVCSAYYDLDAGEVISASGGTATIEDYGNGWYRCILTDSSAAYGSGRLQIRSSLNGSITYQGDGSNSLLIYGATFEQGSYPTSYIPTYGASVTRSYDNQDVTGLGSSVFNNDNLTLFYDFDYNADGREGSTTAYRIFSGSSQLGIKGTSNTARSLQIYSSGSFSGTINFNGAEATRIKVALRITNGTCELFFNGAKDSETIDVSGAAPYNWGQITMLGSSSINTSLNQCIGFPTALTDSECIALTE